MAKKVLKNKVPGRLETLFTALKNEGRHALITFISAGDPDMATTEELIYTLERSGADVIELGIPFSDPMADGPTIQASYERALKKGATPGGVLKLVGNVRKKSEIPIVLFGYYNPILAYGPERFARNARRAGVDGVLVVDLPPEEADELKGPLDAVGIDLIFLLTPTSDTSRMDRVGRVGSGFIYFVSLTGVTGARTALSTKIPSYVKKARRHTGLPVGVGFGISTPGQAQEVCKSADGVVVGSAIINIIAKTRGKKKLLGAVGDFVSKLKRGVNRA
ncbi:MAG: tryptophan synthase subunit alpha [Proteobacteria bacterium]|nr:tryptophan synthase subunit alpha [Pseudomonadota bacterium]